MDANESNQRSLRLFRMAVHAPSSHNTQPWLFRISQSAIDLYADRTRALPVNDPEAPELTISCGCTPLNLRLAAASHSLRAHVQLLPATKEPDWLARIPFTNDASVPTAEAALAEFIERRRTYHKRFTPRELESVTLDQLMHGRPVRCEHRSDLITRSDQEDNQHGDERVVVVSCLFSLQEKTLTSHQRVK